MLSTTVIFQRQVWRVRTPSRLRWTLTTCPRKAIRTVRGSLREALKNLDVDCTLLKNGAVIDEDLTTASIELQTKKITRFEMTQQRVMYYGR